MSSTATSYINSINTNYPVPGVDNDTQGFRDNYSNIKNSLTTLAGEVGSFQLNKVVTNETNDFGHVGSLYRPILDSYGEKIFDVGTVAVNTEINAQQGNYQTVSVSGTVNFNVTNWADNSISNVKSHVLLEITNDTASTATVTFTNTLGSLKTDSSWVTSVTSGTTTFAELWTIDAGATVYLRKVGGNFV